MQVGKDLTSLVERLDAFEDRCGVRIEAVSARIAHANDDEYYIQVQGEIHSSSAGGVIQDLSVEVLFYDDAGRLIDKSGCYINSAAFFGFESFQFSERFPNSIRVSKIRLFPKAI